MNYDCIIIGAGPAGIYAAYEFYLKAPNLRILLIDKGKDIYHRHCPILEHKLGKCPVDKNGRSGCHPSCSITNGFGGAGAFSDGKFNFTKNSDTAAEPDLMNITSEPNIFRRKQLKN